MKRWKVILAAFLIFATGAATGALAFRAAARSAFKSRDPGLPPNPLDGRFDFLGRLARDLSLSEAQSNRIDAILQEGRKRNRQIWDTVQPQLREEMKQSRERMKAELTPEQRTKFDEITKRGRERDRRGPRPDGSGGGMGPGPDGRRRGSHGTNAVAGDTNAPALLGPGPGGPGPGPNPFHGPPPPQPNEPRPPA